MILSQDSVGMLKIHTVNGHVDPEVIGKDYQVLVAEVLVGATTDSNIPESIYDSRDLFLQFGDVECICCSSSQSRPIAFKIDEIIHESAQELPLNISLHPKWRPWEAE